MEPDNLYDSNAVLVMDKHHNELGYISREDNKMIFERLVQNQRYVSCVYSLPSSNFYETIGVNIKISFFKEF